MSEEVGEYRQQISKWNILVIITAGVHRISTQLVEGFDSELACRQEAKRIEEEESKKHTTISVKTMCIEVSNK